MSNEIRDNVRRIIEELRQPSITLYRGLTKKFNKSRDNSSNNGTPNGYTAWIDNVDVAWDYAGQNGFVYSITLPLSKLGEDIIDENPKSETYGDRNLFYLTGKSANLTDNVGDEYYIYNHHEEFEDYPIKEV